MFSIKCEKILKHLATTNRYTKKSFKLFIIQHESSTTHEVITLNFCIIEFHVMAFRRIDKEIWRGGNVQVVNLSELQCTCGRWQQYHFSCSHFMASCLSISKDFSGQVDYYSSIQVAANIWSGHFHPLMNKDYLNFPFPQHWEELGMIILDTSGMSKKGKKSTRITLEMDRSNMVIKHCSIYKQLDHTKQSKTMSCLA